MGQQQGMQGKSGLLGNPKAQPYNTGIVPPQTGGLEPLPPQLAGTGGVKSPSGPYGPPGFIGATPTPQGQWGATVGANPLVKAFGPNHGQFPQTPRAQNGYTGPGPTEGQAPSWSSGPGRQTIAAGSNPGAAYGALNPNAGQPWFQTAAQQAGINTAGMNQAQMMQAYLGTLSPADQADYINKMKAITGVSPMQNPTVGGSGNPFGN